MIAGCILQTDVSEISVLQGYSRLVYNGGIPDKDRNCIEDVTRWVNAMNELSDQLHVSSDVNTFIPDPHSKYEFGIWAAVLSGEHLSTCKV